MIKLTSIEPKERHEILLRFSDEASGILDFTPFIKADTEMTKPLRDPAFFKRCFIELGALAWPNGFDLSAGSLHQRLARGREAAPRPEGCVSRTGIHRRNM